MVIGVGNVLVSPSTQAKGTALCKEDEKTELIEDAIPKMIAGGMVSPMQPLQCPILFRFQHAVV
jgi:hypothetical protein